MVFSDSFQLLRPLNIYLIILQKYSFSICQNKSISIEKSFCNFVFKRSCWVSKSCEIKPILLACWKVVEKKKLLKTQCSLVLTAKNQICNFLQFKAVTVHLFLTGAVEYPSHVKLNQLYWHVEKLLIKKKLLKMQFSWIIPGLAACKGKQCNFHMNLLSKFDVVQDKIILIFYYANRKNINVNELQKSRDKHSRNLGAVERYCLLYKSSLHFTSCVAINSYFVQV